MVRSLPAVWPPRAIAWRLSGQTLQPTLRREFAGDQVGARSVAAGEKRGPVARRKIKRVWAAHGADWFAAVALMHCCEADEAQNQQEQEPDHGLLRRKADGSRKGGGTHAIALLAVCQRLATHVFFRVANERSAIWVTQRVAPNCTKPTQKSAEISHCWCGREDSNFHEVTPTSTSSLRVYHSATTAPW
jgi:hypothetical protein